MKLVFSEKFHEVFTSLPFQLVNDQASLRTLRNQNNSPLFDIRFIIMYNNKCRHEDIDPTSTTTRKGTVSVDVIQAHQEMTSSALRSPVASIVFASSLLPVIPPKHQSQKTLGAKALIYQVVGATPTFCLFSQTSQ